MFIAWFNSLSLEALLVFSYFIVVGASYALHATILYITAIFCGKPCSNDLLGKVLVFTWWCSIAYWPIFY